MIFLNRLNPRTVLRGLGLTAALLFLLCHTGGLAGHGAMRAEPDRVREHADGRSELRVGHLRIGRQRAPGFHDRHQRQQGRTQSISKSQPRPRPSTSTSIASATTTGWALGRSHRSPASPGRIRRPVSLTTRPISSTAVTGPNQRRGWFPPPPCPGSISPSCRGRNGRRQPHPLRRSRRRERVRPAVSDFRHNMAGVQPVRRVQSLCRQPAASLQGEL